MAALALTSGDPSGIGPEIALYAWSHRARNETPAFYLLSDPIFIKQRAEALGIAVDIEISTPQNAQAVFEKSLPVVPLRSSFVNSAGVPTTQNAAGVIEAIEQAVHHVMDGVADAVVTCPIAKKPLYDAGFAYPGHTEFLGHLAGPQAYPVMMLAGPQLRAVPVTVHIPLSRVPQDLSTDMIYKVARITADDLQKKFGIKNPRLAISGLNPHAGEEGAMGHEDEHIIRPAIHQLVAEGVDVRGPLPADTMFHPHALATYDAAICMYHDQALIPAKALAFDETVNVTLGLPFIRTSPDHGTAFDIAGKGIARPDSLIAALKLARTLADAQAVQR